MPKFTFVRAVPIAVTLEADTEEEARELSGHRLDDFMTDALEAVDEIGHDEDEQKYYIWYFGDAIPTYHSDLEDHVSGQTV